MANCIFFFVLRVKADLGEWVGELCDLMAVHFKKRIRDKEKWDLACSLKWHCVLHWFFQWKRESRADIDTGS